MGLSVLQIQVGGYDKNFSYIIYDEETRNAAIVDPCGDLSLVLESIDEHQLDLVGVLITHTHQDHIEKLDELLRSYAVPVHVHESGASAIISPGAVFSMRHLETLVIGRHQIQVMSTPGHMDSAVCFYVNTENAADDIPKIITGDTLFVEGCGRTDKDGVQSLFNSLICLKALPADTIVYPGHDYGSKKQSTIAWEKEHNKYFLAKDFNEFKKLRLG